MDPRRKDEQPEDAMWSSRRVRAPSRSATPPPHVGIRPKPTKAEHEPPIPLLDTKDEDKQAPHTIDINLNLPTLPKLATRKGLVRLAKLAKRRKLRTAMLVAVIGFGGYFLWSSDNSPLSKSGLPIVGKVRSEKIEQKPDYATVLPAGKSIADLGGWARVSPTDRNPVFAYADKIGTTPINVSQQPLPEAFKSEPTAVEDLAKSFNATEKTTVGDIVAYIGTSAKGPQSVIFKKGDLLILIKSTSRLTTNEWAVYISSLR